MTLDFDQLLGERTKEGEAAVHGVLMKCVDKDGNVLYRKIVGKNSVSDNAEPLREDAVLKMGSATKFMTSVALLQCVEKGLIGLDEPISRVLPELQGKPILEGVEGSKLVTRPSTAEISARHLITHMSGLGYWFTHPLLMKWRQSYPGKDSNRLTERFNYPLVFEPGQGWLYGNSLDWAGVAVSRLNGGISLENYMIENMWKRVGRSAPYPTFHVSKHPDYEARLMKAAKRTSTGGLEPSTGPMFQVGLEDDEGGAGLVLTMDDYLAILQDLVSDTPNLLKPEMISMMLEPQIPNESSTKQMLLQGKPAWDMVTGPCKDEDVNHGLGGALVLAEVPEIGQPKNILCWGGSPNIVWFFNRERGVAGFFGTQIEPFGDPLVKELVNSWKKDFWSKIDKE